MANFKLTEMAVKMFCPDNVVQYDDAGLPSLMVFIPAFKLSDVLNAGDDRLHPAFIVNGVEIPGFYYSKYQNVVYDGKAYSLPAEDPKIKTSIDQAREYCEAKGPGWHLSTAAEWAAVILWCKKNGFAPKGNNNYGKDIAEDSYKAIPTLIGDDGKTYSVATGTGPLTWSHNQTPSGIWDMNGNVWEWQAGIRFVWGELQILVNNDAADPNNPQNAASYCWKAIDANTGELVTPEQKIENDGFDYNSSTICVGYDPYDALAWSYYSGRVYNGGSYSCKFSKITCLENEKVKMLLRALALLPDEGDTEYGNDNIYLNNDVPEYYIYRGGNFSYDNRAGLFSLSGAAGSSTVGSSIGFRASYIPNI